MYLASQIILLSLENRNLYQQLIDMFCILKLNFGEEYTKNHKITLKNSQTSFIFTIDFDPTLKNP